MLNFSVRHVTYSTTIRCFIENNHYTQSAPIAARHAFALYDKEVLVGVCAFSNFSSLQVAQKYPYNIELSRLVLTVGNQKNVASFFVGEALRWICRNDREIVAVLAYSDPTEGHLGTVYKACNFTFEGETKPSYHYVDREGKRLHHRTVGAKAQKTGVTEKIYAVNYGLKKQAEMSKLRFRFFLRPKESVKIYGEIYKISNSVTGKVYIGQTINGVEFRFKRHLADAKNGSSLPIHEAMRFFGQESFKAELIDAASNPYDLDNLEAFYIDKYNSACNASGYNIEAGYGVDTYRVPDDVLLTAFKMRSESATVVETAQRLGISKSFIVHVMSGEMRPHLKVLWEAEHGALPKMRMFSEDEKFKVFDLRFNEKKTIYEIADLLGTSATYVSYMLAGKLNAHIKRAWDQRYGEVPTRHIKYLSKEKVEEALKLVFLKKKTIKEAADLLAVSHQRVANLIYGDAFAEEKAGFLNAYPNASLVNEDKNNRVSRSVLLECFALRNEGKSVVEIAAKFDLSAAWLGTVYSGLCRPEVLETWISYGGKRLTQETVGWTASRPENKKHLERPVTTSDGKSFPSIKAAADFYGVSDTAIRKILKAGGVWKKHNVTIFQDAPERQKKESLAKMAATRTKRVKLSDGREFPSAKAAGEALGLHPNTVSRALSEGRSLLGKYEIWYMAEDQDEED